MRNAWRKTNTRPRNSGWLFTFSRGTEGGGGEGVKGKATKSRALLATRARSSSLLAPPWIGDCLDPPPYREEAAEGGGGSLSLGSSSYTALPTEIMVVKRFTSSIFVARNATLIVNLHTGYVQSPPTPFCRTLGRGGRDSSPKRSVPQIPRFISFYALPPDITRCPIFHSRDEYKRKKKGKKRVFSYPCM